MRYADEHRIRVDVLARRPARARSRSPSAARRASSVRFTPAPITSAGHPGQQLGEDAADLVAVDEHVVRPLHLHAAGRPAGRARGSSRARRAAGTSRTTLGGSPTGLSSTEIASAVPGRRHPLPAEPAAAARLVGGDEHREVGQVAGARAQHVVGRARLGQDLEDGDDGSAASELHVPQSLALGHSASADARICRVSSTARPIGWPVE